MKKRIIALLIMLSLLAVAIFSVGCKDTTQDSQQELWSMQKVYSKAQDLGFEGSLDDLIELFKGEKGDKGDKGNDGADGVGIKDIYVNNEDKLIIVLSDNTIIDCGKIPTSGSSGKDGEDGKDGLTPYIKDGYWWIGDTNTNVLAQADSGKTLYETYCEKFGYTGTEEEWLAEIYQLLNQLKPQDIYKIAEKCVVTIFAYNYSGNLYGRGSGFFINDNGLIATAYHVIDGAQSLKIQTLDGKTHLVNKVVAFDSGRDIALIKVSLDTPNDYLCTTNEVTPGEAVYSFGSSLGFLDGSFASGIVASQLRSSPVEGKNNEYFKELQYTAAVSPGNSGGPILNSKGQAMGIVTWKYTSGESLNFATHISELDYLDKTYERSVASFFEDTEYYKIKLNEDIYNETENNNSEQTANIIYSGYTVKGSTKTNEFDFYTFTTNTQSVLSIAFTDISTPTFYYPLLINGSTKSAVEVEWTEIDNNGTTAFCTNVILPAGRYYLRINGYYADTITNYKFYTYWDSLINFNNFAYSVSYSDMLQ